jgi:DNA-binding MarR family transcriptional regulator
MQPSRADIAAMFETVSLGAPQHAVGFVMWRVVHRYQREVDQALRSLDLTHLQFVTLALTAWAGRSATAATQSDLARAGDIHPMQVSKVLGALEAKAMVERRPSETHGSAKNVAVTAAGLATLRMAMPLVIAVQVRLFGDEGRPGGQLLAALLAIDRED